MDDTIAELVATPGTWAVVGLSANTARTAYRIAAWLRACGHHVVPVHPRAEEVEGVPGVANLRDVPGPVDVVDVFVRSALAGPVVDDAVAIGARAVWLQPGVRAPEAEDRARRAGLLVVTGTCPTMYGSALGA